MSLILEIVKIKDMAIPLSVLEQALLKTLQSLYSIISVIRMFLEHRLSQSYLQTALMGQRKDISAVITNFLGKFL